MNLTSITSAIAFSIFKLVLPFLLSLSIEEIPVYDFISDTLGDSAEVKLIDPLSKICKY